ncbi:glycosyltransferase 87 family protein [Tengunoibacter tsumagoiensis]|uniref:Membrane protein n=1 Tax=Tengunoibacter tsumagoiensis TaxID=2014871 RepID=A0A402A1J2_9CHLR|nr:glycosyltransferase 87 family protein [Tengunoibacter tsumagoiensis]GCE13017.1 membrane protein [Tengunoibacter tsumagoiensis]
MKIWKARGHRQLWTILDYVLLCGMCALLFYGASWQFFKTYTDAARYQCYALAFWQGQAELQTLPHSQCTFLTHPKPQDLPPITQETLLHSLRQTGAPPWMLQFILNQDPSSPLHTLPYEYPLLTLIPFSVGLLASGGWYQVVFAVVMTLFAAGCCLLLRRWHSRSAFLACALYFVLGGWSTVGGRFDIVSVLLTLLALLFAVRRRWNWAFAWLALATFCKLYPVLLLLPFVLAQQRELHGPWNMRSRWRSAGVFCALSLLILCISFLLSVAGTLAPFSYFGDRPVQVESLNASLLWLVSLFGWGALSHEISFGSLNVVSPLAAGVSLGMSCLLLLGLGYTYWLQWRGSIDLSLASLLTLLIIMITSKVFSPQYLLWVIPFVAYSGGTRRSWLFLWTAIASLTSWIYPFIYLMTRSLISVPSLPLFYPVSSVRNLLLVLFIVMIFWISAPKRIVPEP